MQTVNRLENLVSDIIDMGDPDDMMLAISEVLTDTEIIPDVGKYYTFIYSPKTPRIRYDQFPLIACVAVFQWGFKGLNFHWGEMRQYTFPEVVGGLYKVDEMELRDLRTIPFGRIRLNS